MVVKGIVDNIVFQNKENGFTVARVSANRENMTIVGIMPALFQGQEITATGKMIKDSRFGEQLKVESYTVEQPQSKSSIIRYLSSGLIKGIGPVTAQKIVEKFGEQTFDVIELSPLKLATVKGVTTKKAYEIGLEYKKFQRMQDVVIFLQEYNISNNMAIKIYNKYGDEAKDIVKNNPYKLVEDMSRVGFKTADKIAISVGIPKDSEFRMRAGLVYVLGQASEHDGNTYLPMENVYIALSKLLDIDIMEKIEVLDNVIDRLVLESVLKRCEFESVPCLMLVKFYNTEIKIATKLITLNQTNNDIVENLEDEIKFFEKIHNVEFHPDQKNAIIKAVNNGVCVITGGPGTGKTTIIKCILQILKNRCGKIALLAPTGRAAKRMSESCKEEASTIHRALMLDFKGQENVEEGSLFFYNETNKFPFDAVIVDEVSMVDVNLMLSLLSALQAGTRLILVGDKNQLPSVGPGNVLADIISSNSITCAQLTYIYRQSESSLIITNAHAINNGQMPVIDNQSKDFFFENRNTPESIADTILKMASIRIPKYLDINPMKIQVLAPMRAGVCGVDNLNTILQERINPRAESKKEFKMDFTTFRIGDKVMQTSNNYMQEWKRLLPSGSWDYGEAVFNGDIGFVTDVIKDLDTLEVTFEDGRIAQYNREDARQLSLSYAITIHKSQGSEFDVVIIPMIAGASSILTRNLLYTAVTRAKQMVVLVGSKKNIAMMVKNNYTAKRYSALSVFLQKQTKNLEGFKI